MAAVPGAPTIGIITPGNLQLSVAFTAGSGTVTNYKYSLNGGAFTAFSPTDAVTPVVITGLTNGTSYSVVLRATNANGDSVSSNAVSSTPRTTAGAPTIGTITYPSSGTISVPFTAPVSDGGSAITNYAYSTTGAAGTFTNIAVAQTTSPISISGLTNGTAYQVSIRAINAAGNGTAATAVAATPRTTPSAPTIGAITYPSSGTVSAAFTAGATGGNALSNYEYSTDNGSSWTVRSPASTATPIVFGGLTNGTTYTLKLRAVNAAGSGATQASGTSIIPRTVPDAPTGVTATPGATTVLSIAWTAPASNGGNAITAYRIERSLDGVSSWTALTSAQATSPYSSTGLTNGTLYYYRVSATNAAGFGAVSSSASGTPRTTPTAPTSLAATTPTAGQQVALTWVAPTGAGTGGNPISGYIIQGTATSNANWTTIVANTGTTDVSYTAMTFNGSTTLVNGTLYYFRVAAINAAGTGTYTAQVSATPKTTPSVPQTVTITSVNKQAVITWTAPASTGGSVITGYLIQGSLDGTTWTTAIANPAAAATSSTVISYNNSAALVNGNTYYFRISALNAVGTGTTSSTLTAIPQIRTWYFSPSGSSANDGFSQAAPKLLLSQAVFGDGDTGYLMDGTHTYSSAVTITKAVTLTSLTDASSTELVFTSAITGGCLNLQGDASAYSLTNLTLTSQNTSTATLVSIGFSSAGASNFTSWPTNVTVSGCKLKIGKYGFALKGENLTITNNTFERFSGSTGSQSVFLVYFTRGSLNITNNTWTDSLYPSRFVYFTGAGSGSYINKANSKAGTMNITGNTLNLTTPNPTARTVIFAIQDTFNTYNATEAGLGGLSSSDVSSFRLLWDISNNSVNHYADPSGTTLKILVPYIGAASDGQGGEFLAQWGSVSMTDNTFNTTGTVKADYGVLHIDAAVSIDISSTLYNNPRFTFRNNSIANPSPFVANASVNGSRLLTTKSSVISQTDMYANAWVTPQLATAPTITSVTPSVGALSVAFTAPDNSGGYIATYEYSTDNGSNWTTPSPALLTSPLSLTGLTNGTSYQIKLRVKNDAGSGTESNSVTGTPGIQKPPLVISVRNQSRPYYSPLTFDTSSCSYTNAVTGATVTNALYDLSGTLNGSDSITVQFDISRNELLTSVTSQYPDLSGDIPYANAISVYDILLNGSSVLRTGTSTDYDISYNSGSVSVFPTAPSAPTPYIASHSGTNICFTWITPVNSGGLPLTGYRIYYLASNPYNDAIDRGDADPFFDNAPYVDLSSATLVANAFVLTDASANDVYVFVTRVINAVGISPYTSLYNETAADYAENISRVASQASFLFDGEMTAEVASLIEQMVAASGINNYRGTERLRSGLGDNVTDSVYAFFEAATIAQVGGANLGQLQYVSGADAQAMYDHMVAARAANPNSVQQTLINKLLDLSNNNTPFPVTYARFVINPTTRLQTTPYPVIQATGETASIIPVPHGMEIKFDLAVGQSGKIRITRNAANMITAAAAETGIYSISLASGQSFPIGVGARLEYKFTSTGPTHSLIIPALAEFTFGGIPAQLVGVTTGRTASTSNDIVVYWTNPNNASITSYTITPSIGDPFTFAANGTSTTYGTISVADANNAELTFTVVATNANGDSVLSDPASYDPGYVPCFPAGVRILTPIGYRAVETLSSGELVQTADGRSVAIKVYTTTLKNVSAKNAPYLIPAHTFGYNSPPADLRLSGLHAFQVKKGLWKVPAYANNSKVVQYGVGETVTYYHIECPNYFRDNLVAEGCVVESYAGKQVKDTTNLFRYNRRLDAFTRCTENTKISHV